ncbi:MAG: hypothetical protein ACM31P_02580 [Actinomycetota bacterium]
MDNRRIMFGAMALLLVFWSTLRLGVAPVEAARTSDVRNTKHNLSALSAGSYTTTGTIPGTDRVARNVYANTESQVCVFCHTPHAATSVQAPLWNRKVAGQGYTQSYVMYDSSSLDAKQVQSSMNQPGGSSKLCLSCHDGTMAIGSVNVLNGQGSAVNPGTVTIQMTGGPNMPVGSGTDTGFTRNLGVNLSNDHPISISYNNALASRDGELRTPDGSLVGARSKGVKPKLPLEQTGPVGYEAQIQCAACHDPHLRETDATNVNVGNQKFLRLNRFQGNSPPSATGFDSRTATAAAPNQGDIICLACHEKNQTAGEWSYSAHANPTVADETYSTTAADQREFPRALPVWKAACLNCHDTHTVQGANRLLREGTDSTNKPKTGGNPALEEACYSCHDGGTNGTLTSSTNVPDIKTDFTTAGNKHMPIKSSEQAASSEVHDINSNFTDTWIACNTATSRCGKDLVEPRSKLGVGDLNNRHAECTDCHNPHRVIRSANGLPGALTASNTSTDTRATHNHAATHSNAISGALRGTWGVEPTYTGTDFFSMPSSYTVKRGDPGAGSVTSNGCTAQGCDTTPGYVTREYQICLKCHSDYGYTDNNAFDADRPRMDSSTALTGINPDGGTNFTRYTNQAREFQPNESVNSTGAGASYQTNNKRSWHPVMAATGRQLNSGTSSRGISGTSPWLAPWKNDVGSQTMYCTDCHGNKVTANQSVVPDSGKPWGPHGSSNRFILKGDWGASKGATGQTSGETANFLCFKCHDSAVYTTNSNSGQRTGFYDGKNGKGNLHNYHVDRIKYLYCTWCHVAVPHGWKNKMFLVNLNDVGAEAGQTGSKEVAIDSSSAVYSNGPYYVNAKLKIKAFSPSGSWDLANCGSDSKTGTNLIANSAGGTGNTTGSGKNWMTSTCKSPP